MPVTNAQDMAKAGSLINSDGTTVSVAADLLIADKLVHTGDTNTAIRFPANDTVTVETSGTERMRIDSSGNVGIGTTSPTTNHRLTISAADARMDVTSTNATYASLRIVSNNTAYATIDTGLASDSYTTTKNLVFQPNGGNIGIGTTNPAVKLDVSNGYIQGKEILLQNGAASSPALGTTPSWYSPASGVAALSTNATERLRIDSSGNVGIGVTPSAWLSTARALQVDNIALAQRYATETYVGHNFYYNSANTLTYKSSDFGARIGFYQGVILFENAPSGTAGNSATFTERLRIDSSGNVGIGTTSPTGIGSNYTTLDLRGSSGGGVGFGSTSAGQFAQIYAVNSDSSLRIQNTSASGFTQFTTNNTERLRITSGGVLTFAGSTETSPVVNGVVGIAIDGSNSYAAFSRSGNEAVGIGRQLNDGAAVRFYRGTTNVGSISVTASATAYNTSSDYRLKTNLEPISNGIDRLKQLPVYRFNWIANDSGNKVDGFVAHEAQAIVPECVTGEKDAVDEDGKPIYQGIDQSKIVPLLTAALKEAIAKIETLESKVAALEGA